LRIAIYPKANKDVPRKDDELNLVPLLLPYDGEFMELFYKSFNLVRAFIKADTRVPTPVALPVAEDRFVTRDLQQRAMFPVVQVTDVIRDMSQQDLLEERPVV